MLWDGINFSTSNMRPLALLKQRHYGASKIGIFIMPLSYKPHYASVRLSPKVF